MYDYVIRW